MPKRNKHRCQTTVTLVAKKQCAPRCADYIVIGVGTAGAVVAKQLSDDMIRLLRVPHCTMEKILHKIHC